MANNLYIQVSSQVAQDGSSGYVAGILTYVCVGVIGQPQWILVYDIGTPNNPSATPRPIFDGDASARSATDGTAATSLLATANAAVGTGYYTSYTIQTVDAPVYADFSALATVANTGAYSDLIGNPSLATVATTGAYSDLTGKPSLATVATSGSYNDLTSKPTIPSAQVNSDWNSSSGISQVLNKPSLATVATSGAYTDLSGKPTIPTALPPNGTAGGDLTGSYPSPTLTSSGVSAGTYAYPSSVIVDAKGRVVSIVAGTAPSSPSFANPSRSFATSFQISSTRPAIVNYSVPITSAATLLAGSQASLTWKYADDSGMTTNVVTLPPSQFGAASGLVVTAVGTIGLSGVIPAGKYVMISQATLAGTPTYGSIAAQEVLL